MEWISFLGSILGGLIGGVFTFLGVKLTLKHDKEKEHKEILLKANENKPRLEVVKYYDFNATVNKKSINNDCKILALKITDFKDDFDRARFFYDTTALDEKNLIFVEYEFKNSGNTEIEDICITSNLPKSMSVFALERKELYINENLLSYEAWAHKRYIKPGQSIRIRVYYIKDQIIVSPISYPFTIWLRDINGRYWRQNFNCPNNEVEISMYSNRNDFKASTDIDAAIECFKKPYLW